MLVLVFAIGSTSVAWSDEAEEFLNYYSWWEGSWDVQTRVEDEVASSSMSVTRQDPNCHLVEGGGISLWGYDPELKKWVGSGFDSEGTYTVFVMARHTGTEIKPGTEQHGKSTFKQKDGTIILGDETWRYPDKDTAVITTVRKTQDGKRLPPTELTFRRK